MFCQKNKKAPSMQNVMRDIIYITYAKENKWSKLHNMYATLAKDQKITTSTRPEPTSIFQHGLDVSNALEEILFS